MTQTLAPIAFFCYNRPDHARRTLEALKANELASDSKLFIFSDGAKDTQKSREGVANVREYLRTLDGFASVEIIEREKNYGCDRNIYEGITQIVNEFGKIIVVEDDILTCPYFLRYMNDGLELYKDDDKAGVVSGFLKPTYENKGFPQTFFSNDLGSWGWGTWQRVWKDFEFDALLILKKIREAGLEDKFNFGFKSKPCSRGLIAQSKALTWDGPFQSSLFLYGRYALKPNRTFTNCIGLDGTGTHCGVEDWQKVNATLADSYTPIEKIPVELNMEAEEILRRAIGRDDHSVPYRAVRKLWNMTRKFIKSFRKE